MRDVTAADDDETRGTRAAGGEAGPTAEPDADAGAGAGADAEAAAGLTTAPAEEPGDTGHQSTVAGAGSFGGARAPGAAGALAWTARELLGWARWSWRQLTSMRVALILLFLLALAAIPGSVIPQNSVDALAVENFRRENEGLAEIYDRLQLFDVYSSVWFSAVYILLFISLIGCIVPRAWQFAGQLRGRPPRAPRRLDRMPASTSWHTGSAPDAVLADARRLLRRRRFRTDQGTAHGSGYVAAEKGYLREAGNLVFHFALIVMLVAFAYGRLYYSEGGTLVVQGSSGFSNTLTQYDDFSSGTLFDVDDLDRFGFRLDEFHYAFARTGPDTGTATEFTAEVTYWTGDDPDTEHQASIDPNHPLEIGGSKVYLLGHGYAPVVTVTDARGDVAFSGPVPFLPQDSALSSTGVIKVPDFVDENGEPTQLGFQGFFNPTYNVDEVRGPHSTFPEPDLPVLTLTAYEGDLGVDSGLPQNVYQLDTSNMEQLTDGNGEPFRFDLLPGESVELPGGKGTLTFDRLENWATFQVSSKAGTGWALTGALAAVAGLAASLLLQRRRVWVRARPGGDGGTLVEMAALGRTESAKVPEELADLAEALAAAHPPPDDDGARADAGAGDEPVTETAQGART